MQIFMYSKLIANKTRTIKKGTADSVLQFDVNGLKSIICPCGCQACKELNVWGRVLAWQHRANTGIWAVSRCNEQNRLGQFAEWTRTLISRLTKPLSCSKNKSHLTSLKNKLSYAGSDFLSLTFGVFCLEKGKSTRLGQSAGIWRNAFAVSGGVCCVACKLTSFLWWKHPGFCPCSASS